MNTIPVEQLAIASVIAAAVIAFSFKSFLAKRKVRQVLAEGALVVDVRSPGEYGSGHYDGAINIPHDRISTSIKQFGAVDRPVVIYCASGARSAMAAATLKHHGYTNVTNAGRLGAMPI
jgi:phage shock protein E